MKKYKITKLYVYPTKKETIIRIINNKADRLINKLNDLYNKKITNYEEYQKFRYKLYLHYELLYNSPKEIIDTHYIHFGYCIDTKKDRDDLKKFCIDNNIPLTYPDLFKKDNVDMKWSIGPNGVGLTGCIDMWYFDKSHLVFHNIDDLRKQFIKVTGFDFK